MDSILDNLPSYNPQNFSQIKPCSDPYVSTQRMIPTYVPTHCTLPPPDQVIKTEPGNIFPKHIYCNVLELLEQVTPNVVAAGSVLPENEFKQLQTLLEKTLLETNFSVTKWRKLVTKWRQLVTKSNSD